MLSYFEKHFVHLPRGGGHAEDTKIFAWGNSGALKISNPCPMPRVPGLKALDSVPESLSDLTVRAHLGASQLLRSLWRALSAPVLTLLHRSTEG